MLCCCFVAEFRLVQFDSCDQQWGYRADVFETEQVLPESRGEFLVSARVVDILQ